MDLGKQATLLRRMYEAFKRLFSRILQPHHYKRFAPGNRTRPTKHQYSLLRAPQPMGKRETGANEDLPGKSESDKRTYAGL